MTRPRKRDRHLPACVYLKHGAYWYVQKGRWTRLGDDLQTALAEYARLRERPTGGMVELIDDALAHMRPKLKPSTAKQYEVAAKKLREILAEFAPDQVKSKHVAAIKVALRDKPNMANRCLSVLRSVFALAVEWQLVESNPCIGIKRHNETKRDRYLTDEELAAIRAYCSPRMQCMIDVLYLTGQRVSDVAAIRLADITSEGIRFRQGKTGAKLLVAWTPELRAVVERAKGLGGNIRALTLFYNRKGKTPDYRTVHGQWDKACEKAGIEDAHIHDIRAKSLTDAKRQGLNPTALAGHVSAAMTDRYIRIRETPVVHGPSPVRTYGETKKN
jgi:integrase